MKLMLPPNDCVEIEYLTIKELYLALGQLIMKYDSKMRSLVVINPYLQKIKVWE